jgi:hypothetical protein
VIYITALFAAEVFGPFRPGARSAANAALNLCRLFRVRLKRYIFLKIGQL